jgi:sugar phosphate isomerase/epimerase
MTNDLTRRSWLKAAGVAAAGVALAGLEQGCSRAGGLAYEGAGHGQKLGWRLGCQSYTFRQGSFFEAIELTASLGLACIDMYPGQTLSKAKPLVHTDVNLDGPSRQEIKARLDDAGVKLTGYGVCSLVKNEAESRKSFEFAKDMGIGTLIAEPPEDAFDTLDKLCEEYAINVAIHNHPSPSHYWDYRRVLAVCKGRGKRIGACADTGHWMRSGIQPIEALRALEGRIISFHLKDLNEFGKRGAHDVPWGTGKAGMRGILHEVARQKFQGVFAIEYEHISPNLVPEIAHGVGYFDAVAEELAGR